MSATRTQAAGTLGAREQVLDELNRASRFLLVTHENPDGDALGSLVAMHGILSLLGKDSVMFMDAHELPLPTEYRFIDLEGLVTAMPQDVEQRTVVFLDCGNIDRNPADVLKRPGARIVNVDHHHDNTRFGTVDLVDPEASCTAEIVWELMSALGVEPTLSIAEALYVGLVTDTGKFMYGNTGVRAHEMAADVIAAGVDVHAIYRRLYEDVQFGKVQLLARGLRNIERFDGGRLILARLTREDFAETGADETFSEGVIDHLRAVEGTAVAAVVRDRLNGDPDAKKVSLRASSDAVDVSRIARAGGGGGHRRAAGFTTHLPWDEVVAFLRGAVAEQVGG